MAYKDDYRLRRIMLVQVYDTIYFEKGNQSRCHKRIWQKASAMFCISYPTYLHYLKKNTSDMPPITDREIDILVDFAIRLDLNRRKIVEGRLPETHSGDM